MDESQLEVSRSLVKFKTFKFNEDTKQQAEQQCKKYKQQIEQETSSLWSDIGHTDSMYYVGYCRAGELAVEAVNEAGRYYHLNVPLTAGYMLGNSWASCH